MRPCPRLGCQQNSSFRGYQLGQNNEGRTPENSGAASLAEIHGLFQEAVADDSSLSLLKGFKMDFSGTQDFHKVYLAVKCQCGTAGLLSVEVAMDKTLREVNAAMPSLLENLQTKVNMFRSMSCEMHGRMQQGRL